jgi:hypothetical protein
MTIQVPPEPGRYEKITLMGGALKPMAFDAVRMAVPFSDHCGGWENYRIAATTDGGKTWTGLGADREPTTVLRGIDGTCVGRTGASVLSDGLYFLAPNVGCAGHRVPSDRTYYRKIAIGEDGWKAYPATPVDSDARHCTVWQESLKLSSGRIWGAWPHWGRQAALGVAAMFSDDGGRTWQSWRPGKHALLPKSLGMIRSSTYAHGVAVHLAPFGGHAVCFVNAQGGQYAWLYDGKAWSEPVKLAFSGTPNIYSAVALAERQVLLATSAGVFLFEGTASLKREEIEGATSGRLCMSGKRAVLFEALGGKSGCIKMRKRGADGTWGAPATVVKDEEIGEWSVSTYAPEGLALLSWVANPRTVKAALAPIE